MAHFIRRTLWRWGLDLVRFQPGSHSTARLRRCLDDLRIGLAFDVGANTGQYGTLLRELGYRGHIISFEPTSTAYSLLSEKVANDNYWIAENMALGSANETKTIHLSGNSQSSSLLEMLPRHEEFAPKSRYVSEEKVSVQRLDALYEGYVNKSKLSDQRGVFLKIDAQGFEKQVMDGATICLNSLDLIQMELSIEPLYQGETTLFEMQREMSNLGFEVFALDSAFADEKSGRVLQVDCLFFRSDSDVRHLSGH